jgi:hypothetical protein
LKGSAALNIAPQPTPAVTVAGGEIKSIFSLIKNGKFVEVTFKNTCVPDDLCDMMDLNSRGFIKLTPASVNAVTAVFVSQDTKWPNLARSFCFQVVDNSSMTIFEKLKRIGNKSERVDLF